MARGAMRLLLLATLTMVILVILILSTLPSSSPLPGFLHGDSDDAPVDWSYGVVIDAGSTGSRLFLYKWQSVSADRLVDLQPVMDHHTNNAVVMKVSPGLSKFADNPDQATDYMKPLLDYAVEFVPEDKRSYTPIFIFATAGMRLVPIKQQEAIMKNLHEKLPQATSMQVIPDHIRVIEGKWEGIYSWIAVNYILGRFDINKGDTVRRPTVGMIDMGGASVQIAIELSRNDESHGEAVEVVNLGCRDNDDTFKYRLFVTTFLGYGVNEGLRKYEQHLSDVILHDNGTKDYIRDSCLPTNLMKTVKRQDGTEFVRKGFGNWDRCVEELTKLISRPNPSIDCVNSKCLLGQILAPSVSLSNMELYGFSEYWFSTEDVLRLGGPYNFSSLASKARDYCKMKWSLIQAHSRMNFYPKANEDRLRSQCFKSAWITAVLHTGFAVDKFANHFQSVFNVKGQEVQWAFGAILYHIRYFPLRDAQHHRLSERHRHGSAADRGSAYLLLGVVAFLILLLVFLRWLKGNKLLLRREPSMWGYMMLSQDQLYPNGITKNFP